MDAKLKKPERKQVSVNSKSEKLSQLVLIGGSAGSFDSLRQIISQLDYNIPVAVLVIVHMGSHPFDSLMTKLEKSTPLSVGYATHDQAIEPGHIYIAPANHHCLIQQGKIYLHRGPRVNTVRPSIDIAFRSAAVNYAARTIGVILSGLHNDGVVGMQAIKSCGGTAIVQSPDEAEYEDMPQQVIESVEANHVLPVKDIAPIIKKISKVTVKSKIKIPDNIKIEYELDRFGNNKIEKLNTIGEQIAISCPDCGGPLWQIEGDTKPHFRCHIGHSLSQQVLLKGQNEKIQQSLWLAYRVLDEKYRIQMKLAENTRNKNPKLFKTLYADKINETKESLEVLRETINNIIKISS